MGETLLIASNPRCNPIRSDLTLDRKRRRKGNGESYIISLFLFLPFSFLLKKRLLRAALSHSSQEGEWLSWWQEGHPFTQLYPR